MDPGLFIFFLLILYALGLIAHHVEKLVGLLTRIEKRLPKDDGIER